MILVLSVTALRICWGLMWKLGRGWWFCTIKTITVKPSWIAIPTFNTAAQTLRPLGLDSGTSTNRGAEMMSTSWMLAQTSYMPYVGGVIKIESTRGVQATRMIRSMASSLPTPRKMLAGVILFSLEFSFLRHCQKPLELIYIHWIHILLQSVPKVRDGLLQVALVRARVAFQLRLGKRVVLVQRRSETVLIRVQQDTWLPHP